jgi:hypothetical protein
MRQAAPDSLCSKTERHMVLPLLRLMAASTPSEVDVKAYLD